MTLFLISFLTVYSCMHLLVFIKSRILLPSLWPVQAAYAFFLVAMIVAPICTRLLERNGHELPARMTAWLGYPWMGFVFLAFCGFLLLSAVDLLLRLLNILSGIHMADLRGKIPTLIVVCVAGAISIYGLLEAGRIRIERLSMPTAKLPAGIDRLKIAQISDVHLGLLVRENRLSRILDEVRLENPDILVSTGDLVDGDIASFNGRLAELFSRFHCLYGKYAVTGNHEYYAGLSRSIESLEGFGFVVLRGEAMKVGDMVNIVGIDDPAAGSEANELSILSSAQNGLFTLYLKHRPEVTPASLGMFDLQLSGHTHKGQIFPFGFITAMVYPMQDGWYDLGNGSKLYTSRGSGTWGPPMRVLSPPEVTIIELRREESAKD